MMQLESWKRTSRPIGMWGPVFWIIYAISSFIIPSKHSLLSLNPMPIPPLFSWSHFLPSEITTKPDSVHLTFFSFSPLFSSIVVGVCCGRAVLFVRSRFCLPSSTSTLSSNPASSLLGSCSFSISLSLLPPSLTPQDTTSTPPLIPSTQWRTSLSNGFLSVHEHYIIFHLEIKQKLCFLDRCPFLRCLSPQCKMVIVLSSFLHMLFSLQCGFCPHLCPEVGLMKVITTFKSAMDYFQPSFHWMSLLKTLFLKCSSTWLCNILFSTSQTGGSQSSLWAPSSTGLFLPNWLTPMVSLLQKINFKYEGPSRLGGKE